MKDGKLYAIWGVLYIFCGLLGFIREANGFLTAILVLLAVLLVVPLVVVPLSVAVVQCEFGPAFVPGFQVVGHLG